MDMRVEKKVIRFQEQLHNVYNICASVVVLSTESYLRSLPEAVICKSQKLLNFLECLNKNASQDL